MTIDFKGERINPVSTDDRTFANHLARYEFAASVISSSSSIRNVLDCACGAGYGTAYLSQRLTNISVTGSDISGDSIRTASELYDSYKCRFMIEDLRAPNDNTKYDCIVSFETLEHIDFPVTYFQKMRERLSDKGCLILSVPDKRSNIDSGYKNEFHLNEMYLEVLIHHLSNNFKSFSIKVQKQRKISKARRVVGKALSSIAPIYKSKLLKFTRKVRKTQNFTGKNFHEFIEKKADLLNSFSINELNSVNYDSDRICYVVVAYV